MLTREEKLNLKKEKALWKTLTPAQKRQQFFDYYLLLTVVVLFVVVVVIFLLWNFLAPHTTEVLNVAVFDDELNTDAKQELITKLRQEFNVTKHETIVISDNYDSATDGPSRLSIYMNAGQVDAVIAEQDIIQQLAEEGIFRDVTTVLTGEEQTLWNASFVEAPGYKEDEDAAYDEDGTGKGEVKPYGISLTGSSLYQSISTKLEKPVFAFSDNMQHQDHAVRFLELLKETS